MEQFFMFDNNLIVCGILVRCVPGEFTVHFVDNWKPLNTLT